MSDKLYDIQPTDEYNRQHLYGEKKYSIQGMLIRQTRFPARAKANDLGDAYTDRCHRECEVAYKKVMEPSNVPTGDGDSCGWFRNCPDEEFLAYAQVLIDEGVCGEKWKGRKITGARMVRYTNAGGYPVYRWDFHFGIECIGSAPIKLSSTRHFKYGRNPFGFFPYYSEFEGF